MSQNSQLIQLSIDGLHYYPNTTSLGDYPMATGSGNLT